MREGCLAAFQLHHGDFAFRFRQQALQVKPPMGIQLRAVLEDGLHVVPHQGGALIETQERNRLPPGCQPFRGNYRVGFPGKRRSTVNWFGGRGVQHVIAEQAVFRRSGRGDKRFSKRLPGRKGIHHQHLQRGGETGAFPMKGQGKQGVPCADIQGG